jgi:ATP-dependent DNA helicase RecG
MNKAGIKKLIRKGEGISIELKECLNKLNKDVFESICAFLNRNGGDLILGVNDSGKITGIAPEAVEQVKKDLVTALNNPQKLDPPCYLMPEEVVLEDKRIIRLFVPESSQVHRCNGKIYDRNEDGDFDITSNTNLVTALYIRKQTTYSENLIYPYVSIKDLRLDLVSKARKLAVNQRPGHPWAGMSDIELLKSAQLFQMDYQSGKEGFTLAAILLLGDDNVILSVLPHHRTDALLRRQNIDRYDDRDDIRTNLIESYDRLMAFVAKHLPDKFFLEKDQRISLRDHIFREVAANMLIHREFLNPYPAKFIIETHRLFAENSNKPHGQGLINPANFSPFPKNPVIARFFKEIGLADELGSGVRNLFKYCLHYSDGKNPELVEEDIFKCIVPLAPEVTMQDAVQVTMQATMQDERIKKIIEFCEQPRSREKIQKYLNLKNRDYLRKHILNPLIKEGVLRLTIPDKPRSPNQKYYAIKEKK